MNSYRNPNSSFSFLPEDTITPAIQNLGQSLGAINQQKIGQQEELKKQFAALLDASYGDIWAKDQQEVTADWEKLKSNAIGVFKKASEAGAPINQGEYTNLMKQHKDLVMKAEIARQYKNDWATFLVKAADLKKDNKLAPGVMEKFEAAKNNPGSILDRIHPSTFIETQHSPDELLKLQGLILDPKIIARKQNVLNADGTPRLDANKNPIMQDFYDEDNVRGALDNYAEMDKGWKRQVSEPYGGNFEAYKNSVVDLYDKNGLLFSKESKGVGSQAPIVNRATRMPLPDGTFQITFSDDTPKEIILNGKSIKASSGGAIYDPKTNTYKTYLRIPKKVKDEYGVEKVIEEQVVTEDYAVYQKFAEEVKGRVSTPKDIKGGKTEDKRVDLLNTIIKKK